MNRRDFIGTIAAAAVCPGIARPAADPTLRIGLITDTHVRNDKRSCARVGEAWRLFRQERVDIVANVGDIADRNYPQGYVGYRETVDEAWPAGPDHPREVYVFAWHDYYGYRGDMDRSTPKWREACAEAARLLKSPNGLYDSFELKGHAFVVVPQWADWAKYEELVAAAVARHPGEPVFLFDHVPPFDTVYNSRIWGDRRRLELLSKYPTVIDITGHVHQSLRVDTSIWQGAFTVVNCGTLSNWGGNLVGTSPRRKPCFNAIVMDVYGDRLELRRFDVRTKKEILPEDRWTIPLPFVAKDAPYAPGRRAASTPVASFPAGARLVAAPDAVPFTRFNLTFPQTRGAGAFEYRIELCRRDAKGVWTPYARQDIFSDFWQEDFERKGDATHAFPAGYFATGETIHFRVSPVNAFGRIGKPLETQARVPEKAKDGVVVWECDQPMTELPFMTGLKDGRRLAPGADGFYSHETHEARLMLPKEVWDGPADARFRFTIDMEMIQPGGGQWTLVLRNPEPMENANERIATPKGESGPQRYVIEFAKRAADHRYYFLVREGTPGRIRFSRVKVERLS